MSNANIGYLFYKEYYMPENGQHLRYNEQTEQDKEYNKNLLGPRNKTILGRELNDSEVLGRPLDENKHSLHTLAYTTTYPGLVLGTGYTHEAGLMGEFKLGFHFDYTTGMPIIPGSSVKGMLRSVFPGREKDPIKKNQKAAYIWYLLGRTGPVDMDEVVIIENEIFEGINHKNTTSSKPKEKYLPLYKRDIFFDAILSVADLKRNIFGTDYITPHKHKTDRALDPFADPTPLMFLKVLPNVIFEFCFCLQHGKLDINDKLALFRNIIEDIGAGAKTNVGYGQMIED